MFRFVFVFGFTALVFFVGGDAMAQRGSVVSGKYGVTPEGRNLVKTDVGGKSGEKGGNNGNKGGGSLAEEFRKWPLPPAAEIEDLDTSDFDKAVDSLKLIEEQLAKIEEAKKEIKETRELLLRAQTVARDTYEKAQDRQSCQVAGGEVLKTAQECQKMRPNSLFERKLSEVLTAEQKAALRKGG